MMLCKNLKKKLIYLRKVVKVQSLIRKILSFKDFNEIKSKKVSYLDLNLMEKEINQKYVEAG